MSGRHRFQRGELIDDGDRWLARWREDVLQPDGTVKRVRRKDFLAMKKDCATKRLAQRLLDEKLRDINQNSAKPLTPARMPDLHTIELQLCDSCRERLIAALIGGSPH